MSKRIFKLSLSILVLTVLVSGCTLPWKKKNANSTTANNGTSSSEQAVVNTNQLKKFDSDDDLKKFLQENNNSNNQVASPSSLALAANTATDIKSLAPAAVTSNNTLDYSSTNNQVSGVDEPDIVKTDGTYVYDLVKNDLKIIKANPAADATVVSTISFKSRPEDIFINGTSLAVLGTDQQIYTLDLYKSFRRQNSYTFFKVFDLSNPSDPKLVRDLSFEGSFTDARLIGDYVYLFTNSYGNYIEGEPLTPRVLDSGAVLPSDCSSGAKCFAPDVYYFDIPYDSYNFTNITAINIKDNSELIKGQSYIMNYGQNLYVSQNNIYITYTQTLNEYDLNQAVKRELIFPKLTSDDQDKITKIEAAASYILSDSEKKAKVGVIIDNYFNNLSTDDQTTLQASIDDGLKQKLSAQSQDLEKTIIHKIAINGASLEYKGMGEVGGQVLNQFSMDENGAYFRIATTRSQIWSRLADSASASYNNIYVLDNELKVVGSLENLATNEKIYAARFIGDRVYLVTYQQTDPLYAISLSDPTKPSVLGAIKIPGYSTYLHPANSDGSKLIGLGRDTEVASDGSVKVKGLKLALFDFSDLNQPKELDSYVINDADADSIALYDHKAFLYSEEKNLLSFPAVLYDNSKIAFAGSLVFGINNDKFVLKGKIDHSDGGSLSSADTWNGFDYYDNTVKRSLFINDDFYSFSNKYLKINSLSDLSAIKSLTLTTGANDYTITPPASGGATSSAATSSSGIISPVTTTPLITPPAIIPPVTTPPVTLPTSQAGSTSSSVITPPVIAPPAPPVTIPPVMPTGTSTNP